MVALISTPWMAYIKLKHRLFGLMPLQALVNKYHEKETDKSRDPLWTYWLFLTYEGEVMEAIQKANNPDEEEAKYIAISKSLRESKNPANHNVKWKLSLHLLALGVISILMVGIAASNTISLFAYFEKSDVFFGSYKTLAMGSVFVSSICAQWLIFRKNVTKMLKALLSWSNEGSDFFETRELGFNLNNKLDFITNEENDNPKIKGYYRRRAMFYIIGLCTAGCALAWGSVVHAKLGSGLSDESGYLGLSEGVASVLGWQFGAFAGFAAFFLWISGLRTDINSAAKAAKGTNTSTKLPENNSTPLLLAFMLLLTVYSLSTTMLGQGAIVFQTFSGDEDANPLDPNNPEVMCAYLAFVFAIVLGRANFTKKAMTKLYENGMIAYQEASMNKIRNELSVYKSNYLVGSTLTLGLAGVLWTSIENEAWRKPLLGNAINEHGIFTPMGIAVVSAVFLWAAFIVAKRWNDGLPDQADKIEEGRVKSTVWFTGGAGKGSSVPSGKDFVDSAVNATAYGSIGGGGAFDTVTRAGGSEVVAEVCAGISQGGSGLISKATANQPSTIQKPSP